MADRPQWTGQSNSDSTVPPTLQQMFALARKMGYEMRLWISESALHPWSRIPSTIPARLCLFPILICDLSTDAIIGTDTLGSMLAHTLDIKNGLLFTDGGVSLQLHRIDTALSGRVLTVVRYHHTQRQCFIAPCEQWAAGPCPPADNWKDLHYLRRIQAL